MACVVWSKMLHSLYCTWRMLMGVLPRPMGEILDLLSAKESPWKMALAHKAFRFPAMSCLKLPDGFSWTSFHKQESECKEKPAVWISNQEGPGKLESPTHVATLPWKDRNTVPQQLVWCQGLGLSRWSPLKNIILEEASLCGIIKSKIYPQREINF